MNDGILQSVSLFSGTTEDYDIADAVQENVMPLMLGGNVGCITVMNQSACRMPRQ